MRVGLNSPHKTNSIEHIYGVKNLPSDEISKVVSNQWMLEAAMANQAKQIKMTDMRANMPKGLKSKPTVTSLLRKEANKRVMAEMNVPTRSPVSIATSKLSKRNQSMNMGGKPSMQVLPPL